MRNFWNSESQQANEQREHGESLLSSIAESLPMIFTKFIKLKILYIENYVDCDFLNVLRASWFSS
jgi:hypothetical protein